MCYRISANKEIFNMFNYKNNKINKIPELKIGDGKLLKKFECSKWYKLIFNKEFKFTWRW